MQTKDIIVDERRVRAYLSGPNEEVARTIVFLHGWRSDASVWFLIMRSLDDGETRLVSLDLPGFGSSETPKRPLGVSGYRDVVGSVLDTLALKGVVLVGHSFGGSIAITLAAVRSELVTRLVLINSAGVRPLTASKKTKRGVARLVKPLFRPKFMQPLRRKIYTTMGAEDYVVRPDLAESYKKIIDEDITGYLQDVTQPTLLLWGNKDQETPIAHAKTLRKGISSAELVVFNGAGHFSFVDEPERFLEHLKSFIGINS